MRSSCVGADGSRTAVRAAAPRATEQRPTRRVAWSRRSETLTAAQQCVPAKASATSPTSAPLIASRARSRSDSRGVVGTLLTNATVQCVDKREATQGGLGTPDLTIPKQCRACWVSKRPGTRLGSAAGGSGGGGGPGVARVDEFGEMRQRHARATRTPSPSCAEAWRC